LSIHLFRINETPEQAKLHNQRISQSLAGRRLTTLNEQSLTKLSQSLVRAHAQMPIERKLKRNSRISEALVGRHLSESHKQHCRDSHIGLRYPNRKKGYKLGSQTEVHKEKVKHTWFKQGHSVAQKCIDALKNYVRTEQWEAKRISSVIHACHPSPNKSERRLDDILKIYFPGQWQYVGNGKIVIGAYCPDFININSQKQIIELFGDYWHTRPNIPYHQTEIGRKEIFSQYGYKTLIIWERELKNEEKLISKIHKFVLQGGDDYDGAKG